VFTYHVKQSLPPEAKLVLTVTDDAGRQIRRMDVETHAGLRRVAWNLRGDPPTAASGAAQGGRAGGQSGGRGGTPQAPLVSPGRYRATLGRMIGDVVTPLGSPQYFSVVQISQ
jgi:hypothetical protein